MFVCLFERPLLVKLADEEDEDGGTRTETGRKPEDGSSLVCLSHHIASPPPPSSPWPLLRRQAVALLQQCSPKKVSHHLVGASVEDAAIKPRQSDTIFVFVFLVVVLCLVSPQAFSPEEREFYGHQKQTNIEFKTLH